MVKNIINIFKKISNNLPLFLRYWRGPSVTFLTILACHVILVLTTPVNTSSIYNHFLKILILAVFTWAAIQAVRMIRKIVILRTSRKHYNYIDARRVNTKIDILARIIMRILIIVGISSILMTFTQIRELGISILASAGVAGVILGFAAQKSLASIFAGIQIAFTQPIKIGDEIVIEDEPGTVEEINLTYVVISTVDKRRLIIPINYFIEKSFQNWTRNSLDLIGVVYLEVDYSAPVATIRETLDSILEETTLWDRRFKVLQVTDFKTQTMELRILASAANPSEVWNLRCHIREHLIAFLQKNHPDCLPKMRLELAQREPKTML